MSRRAALIIMALLIGTAAWGEIRPAVVVRPAGEETQEVVLIIDGKVMECDAVQMVRGQQVMVRLRDLETMGWGKIETAPPDQIVFKGKGVVLGFTKGKGVALVNSLAVRLPVDTYLRDNKLMVPISFVAKALGYEYDCTYKAVATVTTQPARAAGKLANAIEGKVLYNGSGAKGIIVRAVYSDYRPVKGAMAATDDAGTFKIEELENGEYKAYVYVEDNPLYFNAASEPVTVRAGQTAQVKAISLVRSLTALHPRPGQEVRIEGGEVNFIWNPCEGAATYKLSITKLTDKAILAEATSEKASARIPSAKLKPGIAYQAEVRAFSASGERLGSTSGLGKPMWRFTVAGAKSP